MIRTYDETSKEDMASDKVLPASTQKEDDIHSEIIFYVMADIWINVENILVKSDKFYFTSDFVVTDMVATKNEIVILERPFLVTIHTEIDVFAREITLGTGGKQ
nr:hypothetical protein [Tanacetum cinerariifolium]